MDKQGLDALASNEGQPWGYHLIVDCRACDISRITDRDNIIAFVKTLVERIDMRAYGEPILEHFATHDPDKAGYSLVQLIETSNITAHFVDKNGDAYVDIFSCKSFDPNVALAVIDEFFQPEYRHEIMFYRAARNVPFQMVESH